MSFGERMRARREELHLSRNDLAERLGISCSAVGNYETGVSFPKEEIVLQLFNSLQTEPNYLYQDSFQGGADSLSRGERQLLAQYRELQQSGRRTVHAVVDALCAYQEELVESQPEPEFRQIPLYRCPAAAGYAAPVFGEDFDYIPVTEELPRGVEYAVRIQGDSMSPAIADGSTVYVNRDPLAAGDIGIFCVDGDMLCKQYYRDGLGIVYLFSLNRRRADADVVLTGSSGRTLVCFGRVMMRGLPLPGR
ncbi:MAG: LexA family transcriptional regulator [Oscillospiraceae bacterium]